jgi:hypothetical protein
VRDDNPGAISLYRQLGFVERARRTSWRSSDSGSLFAREASHPGLAITTRHTAHWPWQKKWLERAYPSFIAWYFEQSSWSSFAPGLFNNLLHILMDTDISHWGISERQNLLGLLTFQGHHDDRSDRLWLAFPARPHQGAVTDLLIHARKKLGFSRSLSIEYPAGPLDDPIREAGFCPLRTLLWMEAPGK